MPLSANWMRVSPVSVISCVRPTLGTSPVAVGGAGSSGGGAEIPTEGTSPAKTAPERTQVRVTIIAKRFMDISPLKVEDARVLTSRRIEQLPEVLARRKRDH
jgi:hypothetical protein